MRTCPEWFQNELTRIGGKNPYGEPMFKLVWSPTERMVIGGRWAFGFEGYKEAPAIFGAPCWALMVWEPRELNGTYETWDWQSRDNSPSFSTDGSVLQGTGLLIHGGYPKYGYYRLMKRFMHREVEHKEVTEPVWIAGVLQYQKVLQPEFVTYRMEPCGLILDMIFPMILKWRQLSDEKKHLVLAEREEEKTRAFLKTAKDIRDGNRISRGSQLVAKRAEIIEKGFMQAMKIAAKNRAGNEDGTMLGNAEYGNGFTTHQERHAWRQRRSVQPCHQWPCLPPAAENHLHLLCRQTWVHPAEASLVSEAGTAWL